nr:DNA replication ATP-dependent helicase/nuclease DNA2 [Tanacetum cinerariifolium]
DRIRCGSDVVYTKLEYTSSTSFSSWLKKALDPLKQMIFINTDLVPVKDGKAVNNHLYQYSKFVTDVKLVKDLHTSNYDQLHAYLEQHELHANEVHLMRKRNQDPLAFVANQQMTPPHFSTYQSSYNNPQLLQQFLPSQQGLIQPHQHYSSHYPSPTQFNHLSIPPSHSFQSHMNHQTSTVPQVIPQVSYQSPQAPTQLMTESPFVDSGFVVLVFSLGYNSIACLNKAMSFLTVVASLRFPSANNQLRTSSNTRNQATIQDGRPKPQRNAAWYKEKAMLAEAQEAGQILDGEQLAFLADPGIQAGQEKAMLAETQEAGQILDEEQLTFLADPGIPAEVPNSDNYLNDMDNQSVHVLQDFEQSPVMDFTNNKISSDSNIIPNSQYLQETQQATVQDTNLQAQQDSMILYVIEQMSEQMINHVNKWEKANKEHNKESIIAELERYKERVKTFKQCLNIDLSCREKMIDSQMDDMTKEKLALKEKPQSFYDNVYKQALEHVAMPVIDNEETLMLEEESRSKMSEKAKDLEVITKKISHKPIDYVKLNRLTDDFGKHFTPQQELSAEQAFWLRISNPTIESSLPGVRVEVPNELPKVSLVNESLKKLKIQLAQFDSVVKKRTTPNALTK